MAGEGVSAIIVSYFTGPILDACLSAVSADNGVDEIILVDNGNPPSVRGALHDLKNAMPKLQILSGHGNIGFARGCNLGARAARGAYLMFLNPDAVLSEGAARALKDALACSARPSLAGGILLGADGRLERGCWRARVTLWSAFASFSGLSRLEGLHPILRDVHRHRDPLPERPIQVGAVSGALMMMRGEEFWALGGFDEGYFLHVEDLDLCRRVEDAGGAVLLQPLACGVHARSTSAASPIALARSKARGFARYFRKFARSPIERALCALAGACLNVLLPMRAWLARP